MQCGRTRGEVREPDLRPATRSTGRAGSNPQPFDAPSLYNLTVGAANEKRGLALASRMEVDLPSLSRWLGPGPWSLQLLMRRYRCSRETLREAIGILDSRGQIDMKSGRNGGITAKLPQVSEVVLPLADCFCLNGVTIAELCEATEIFRSIVIRLRAQSAPAGISHENGRTVEKMFDDADAFETESRSYRNIAIETGNAVTILTIALMDILGRYAIFTAASVEINSFVQGLEKEANVSTLAGPAMCSTTSKYAPVMNSRLGEHHDVAIRIPVEQAAAQETTSSNRAAILLAKEMLRNGIIAGSNGNRISFENHIIEYYNVGRRRVRQAIRILEDAGVVECHPGRGNGLMAAEQTPATLQRRVFGYLATNGFDEEQYVRYVSALDSAFARLAATCVTAHDHPWLQKVVDGMQEDIKNNDPLQSLGRLFSVYDRLIVNPLLKMWRKALCACHSKLFPHNISITKLDNTKFIEAWIRVIQGIMTGDPDEAERQQISASKFLFRRRLN